MNGLPKIAAFRHAPPVQRGICYGWSQTEVSVTASKAASKILGQISYPVSVVWSSDLKRCQEPAAAVASYLQVPHKISNKLRELHFGRWEGKSWADIHAGDRSVFERWAANWQTARTPDGESWPELSARVADWLRSLNGSNVLVAHAGIVRVLRVLLGGLAPENAMRTPVEFLSAEEWTLPTTPD